MSVKDEQAEFIQDLEYLVRSNEVAAKWRGAASFRHAPAAFQADQEIGVCEELAVSLSAHGKGSLMGIRKNDLQNFPDCLAELDGDLVGIEDGELMDPDEAHTPWPINRFAQELSEAIQIKDAKAGQNDRPVFLATIAQLVLVIHTDETALTPQVLDDYLSRLSFPKPHYIDRALVLGPWEAAGRPVIRGREHEAAANDPRCKALSVAWARTEIRE